jgi:hypothetical protein
VSSNGLATVNQSVKVVPLFFFQSIFTTNYSFCVKRKEKQTYVHHPMKARAPEIPMHVNGYRLGSNVSSIQSFVKPYDPYESYCAEQKRK